MHVIHPVCVHRDCCVQTARALRQVPPADPPTCSRAVRPTPILRKSTTADFMCNAWISH